MSGLPPTRKPVNVSARSRSRSGKRVFAGVTLPVGCGPGPVLIVRARCCGARFQLSGREETHAHLGWVGKQLEAASPDLLQAMVRDFTEGILVTTSGTATGSRFVSSQSSPMESPSTD